MTPVVALSIAGSDSGAGAGVQADLKTFAAHGVYGTCAVTAVTAQNTLGVSDVVAIGAPFVTAQVLAVVTDFPVRAVKTGMLCGPDIVRAVAELAADGRLPNLVVDPVLVSSSGHPLLAEGGLDAYSALLPHAVVATPNLEEAAALTGRPLSDLRSVDGMARAAAELRAAGPAVVVVTGGHLPGAGGHPPPGTTPGAPDVVAGPDGTVVLDGPRIVTRNDHGTGCTFSAAIAAHLALGHPALEAVRRGHDYVRRALAASAGWRLGAGRGPLDHVAGSGLPS